MGRMLRSVTAKELAFWEAFEEVEGPIGHGPLMRAIAWLGWLQCEKIEPDKVLEGLAAFVANPTPDDREEAEEPTPEEAQAVVYSKLAGMFPQPEN